MKYAENIHGIIVFCKILHENSTLIGVLVDESRYVKGYIKNSNFNYTCGQQVIGKIDFSSKITGAKGIQKSLPFI